MMLLHKEFSGKGTDRKVVLQSRDSTYFENYLILKIDMLTTTTQNKNKSNKKKSVEISVVNGKNVKL